MSRPADEGPGFDPYEPPRAAIEPESRPRKPARIYSAGRRALDRFLGSFWLCFGCFWLAIGLSDRGQYGPTVALTVGLPLTTLGAYLLWKSSRRTPEPERT